VIRPTRSVLFPLVALAAALGPTPARAQEVVELPRRDRMLEARLETVATIGKFDGADWETFGDIRDLDFDAAGNLYIFDGQKSRVVVVDASGRLVRTFGKEGDGPGELRQPVALVVNRDGSSAIADMGHRAFVLFGPLGAYSGSVPFGGDAGTVILGRLFPDGRRGVLSAGQTMMMMTREVGRGGPQGPLAPPRGHPIVRFSLEGEGGSKQLLRAWQPERPDAGGVQMRGMGGGAMMFRGPEDVAFEPRLLSGVLPDGGLAFSDSSAYAIKLMGPDGAVRRVLTRPLEPGRVTRAIQDAEKARRLEELEAGGGPQMRVMIGGAPGGGGGRPQPISQEQIKQMRRQQIEQMQFYPELPVLLDLATGWSGKIWAVRRDSDDVAEPGVIDLIAPTGEYLGSVSAAAAGLPRAFGPNGLAAYVERDDLDVPRVVVRRLPATLR
jgi:hypothetical protein